MKKIGILASYNGSGFETIQKAIEDKILDAKVVVIIQIIVVQEFWKKQRSMELIVLL